VRLPQRPATGSQPMQSDGRRGDRMMNRRAAAAQKRRPNRSRPKACSRRGSLWSEAGPTRRALGMFSHVVLRRPASCFGRPIRSRLPRRQLRPLPLCSRGPSCEPIRRPFPYQAHRRGSHTSGFPLGIESRDPDIPILLAFRHYAAVAKRKRIPRVEEYGTTFLC